MKTAVACEDEEAVTQTLNTIQDQFNIQMSMLCSDMIICNNSLRLHECQPSVKSSIITVEFDVHVRTVIEEISEAQHILQVHTHLLLS